MCLELSIMPQLQEEAMVEAFDEEVYRVKFGKVSDTLFVYIDLLFPNPLFQRRNSSRISPSWKNATKPRRRTGSSHAQKLLIYDNKTCFDLF